MWLMEEWPRSYIVTLGAHAGADFGEIKPDAARASDAVEFFHEHIGDIQADGAGVIENDAGDRIVGQLADEAGAQAKPGAGVGDVEFAAADIDFEGFGKFDAAMTRRRQADHAFAESQDVKLALRGVA